MVDKDIMKKLIFNYKLCTEYATQDKTFEKFEEEFDNNFEHWYKHASIIENYLIIVKEVQ